MFDLILDKNLRLNLRTVLKFKSENECDAFIFGLSEMDRDKLLTYVDAYYLQSLKSNGIPINAYFLNHYDKYMTERDFAIRAGVNRGMHSILGISFLIAAAIVLWKL